MVEKIKPSYQTSFVPKNKNEQLAFDIMFQMMLAAKQQILLRRALNGTKQKAVG